MKDFLKVFIPVMVIGIILLIITSCKVTKPTSTSSVSSKIKDSIIYKETVKWDTVTIPGSITEVYIPVNCDTSKKTQTLRLYQSKSNQANLTVKDSANHLTINCTCDSFKAIIATKNTEISNLKSISDSSSKTISVPVRYVPWYDMVCRWISGILILLIIIYILIKPFI